MLEKIKLVLESLEYSAISILFGFGSFLYKVKYEKLPNNKSNLIHELLFSTMSGYLAYKLCLSFDVKENMIGIIVGVASYSGTRFIVKLSRIVERHIEVKFNGEVLGTDDDLNEKVDNSNHLLRQQNGRIRPNPQNRSRIIHRN